MRSGNFFTLPQLFTCISECSRVMQWTTQLFVPGCSFINLQENGSYIPGNFWNVGVVFTAPWSKRKKKEFSMKCLKKKS